MNRLISSLTLLVLLMVACQPIRPESELATPATVAATLAITSTTSMTDTAILRESAPVTQSDGMTVTDEITTTTPSTSTSSGQSTSTPSTPSSGTTASVPSCPAIGDDAGDIEVTANWEEGEQRVYLMTQSRAEGQRGEELVTLASTTPVTMTVVRADDEGYELVWSYGQSELGETDVELADPIAALFQSPIQVEIHVAADRDGAYVELLNVEDLQEQLLPIFDELFDILEETDEGLTPEVLEAARGMVNALVSDPTNFETLLTREVQLFHALFGFYFTNAEPLVLPDSRPNMLGGSPVPSVLTLTPTHYDVAADCLHIALENVADPVETRNSILQALQEQARQMGVPGPTDADLPPELDMVDHVRYELEAASGWPLAIYTERSIAIADQTRIDTVELVSVEPE